MADGYGLAGQLEDAVAECETALEINPNCTVILDALGYYLARLGRPQESLEASRLALRLNPRDPGNYWRHHHMAIAHFMAADYTASLEESRRVARSQRLLASDVMWAAAATALDKADEAQTALKYCLSQRPDLRVSIVPAVLPDLTSERLLALLRKAGLPD